MNKHIKRENITADKINTKAEPSKPLIVGGISFGPQIQEPLIFSSEPKIVNTVNDKDTAKLFTEGNPILYFELLRLIANNDIIVASLQFKDNNDREWRYDMTDKSFRSVKDDTYFSEAYCDIELPGILVTRIPPKIEPPVKDRSRAEKQVIKELENLYMDLDMEIDCCQGCMEGLDDAFEELHIYGKILKDQFGVDIKDDATRQRMVDEWFAKKKAEREEEERNHKYIFDSVETGIDLLISGDKRDKVIFNIAHKLNQLLKYLNDKNI